MLWTDDEIEILKSNYPYKQPSEMERLLPKKNKNQIKRKANSLDIKKADNYKTSYSKIWSEQELQILRNNYSDCTIEEITKLLPNKNKTQITGRASYEGLKKTEEVLEKQFSFWTDEEVKTLKMFYEISSHEEMCDKLPNKNNQQINYKANSLGLKKDEEYLKKLRAVSMMKGRGNIWTDEEIAILKQYYHDGGAEECVKHLKNRNVNQIYSKASSIGLKTRKAKEEWKRVNAYPHSDDLTKYTFEYIKRKGRI